MVNQSVVTAPRKIGLGIDQLWLVGALVGFAFLLSLYTLPPNDFWWHLKTGEIIVHSHSIPRTNLFGWSIPLDTAYVYGAWLAGSLFYKLFQWGGLELVIFTRTVLALAAFGLLGYECYRRSGSWRIAGVLTEVACIMVGNNLIVRPQNFAWIPFIVFLFLLSAYADGQLRGRWLLLCPLVMAFWVNVHGSFVLGAILVGIFFAGEAARRFLKLSDYRSWKEIAWLGINGLLTLSAMLANPLHVGIIGYVHKMMSDRTSQSLIVEWQSPSTGDFSSIVFFISVMLLIVVLVYTKYQPTPSELLSVIAFLWLAFSGVRYVVWFGFIVMPVIARSLREFAQKKRWLAPAPRNLLNLVIGLVLVLPLVAVQPWFVEKLPLPEKFTKQIWVGSPVGPLLTTDTPIQASEYLKQHPGGKLFNEMGYGSYLIWALPDQKVFVDPRVELYPYELWLDYIRISNGTRYNELLDKYGVDRLLLDLEQQEELILSLENDLEWQREYADPYAQVWSRAGAGWDR